MKKQLFYYVMLVLAFGLQGCDDDEPAVSKVVLSTQELQLNGDELSKIVTYTIEDKKEDTKLTLSISNEEIWSFVHDTEHQKIEIKCAASKSMTELVGTLQIEVVEGGRSVSTSELRIVKEAVPSLSTDYFTVTPQVLEAVGGKVPVTINGRFPELYFDKKAIVEVVPVLKWNGGEAKGQSATFQGEDVAGDRIISYKAGGSYTMKASFTYISAMAKSELYLEFKTTIGEKAIQIPLVKIADGVISTY